MGAAFDTLRVARTLRDEAHFSSEQAEGIAAAIGSALEGDVARTGDVLAVRNDLRETELRLKAEIEAAKADMIKWMFGTLGLQTSVILGAGHPGHGSSWARSWRWPVASRTERARSGRMSEAGLRMPRMLRP